MRYYSLETPKHH